MKSFRTLYLCAALAMVGTADLAWADGIGFERLDMQHSTVAASSWTATASTVVTALQPLPIPHLLPMTSRSTARATDVLTSLSQPAQLLTPTNDASRARLGTLLRAVLVENRERERARETAGQFAARAGNAVRPELRYGAVAGPFGRGPAADSAPRLPETKAATESAPVQSVSENNDATASAAVDNPTAAPSGNAGGPGAGGAAQTGALVPLPAALIKEQQAVANTLALLDRSALTSDEETVVDLLREMVTALDTPASTPSTSSSNVAAPTTPGTSPAPSVGTVTSPGTNPVSAPVASGSDESATSVTPDQALLVEAFVDAPMAAGDLVHVGAPTLIDTQVPTAFLQDTAAIANPEPASVILLVTGLVAAAPRYRRRR